MIVVTLLDMEICQNFSQLCISVSQNQVVQESHNITCLPLQLVLQQKEMKLILYDGHSIIGSVTIPQKLIIKQVNLVRWITLFDPKDDLYDGNFLEDDIEQPRLLLRFESNQNASLRQLKSYIPIYDKKKIQQIVEDNKEMQNKYNQLKEDLLQYRDISQQEIKLFEQEKQQYIVENKNLKQQLQQFKLNEQNHNESIQEIQQKLSSLSDDIIQESQETGLSLKLVEKIKQCFQNINVVYDSLSNCKNNQK